MQLKTAITLWMHIYENGNGGSHEYMQELFLSSSVLMTAVFGPLDYLVRSYDLKVMWSYDPRVT